MALCLCDQAVNCHHILFYLLRKIQMITDDVLNVVEAAVVMMVVTVVGMLVSVFMVMVMCLTAMVVVMVMVVFLMAVLVVVMMIMRLAAVIVILVVMVEHLLGLFLSMHLHGHMGSADATLAHSFFAEFHAWNPKSVQFCHNRIRVRHQFQ